MLVLDDRTFDESSGPERLEWMVVEELSPKLVFDIFYGQWAVLLQERRSR